MSWGEVAKTAIQKIPSPVKWLDAAARQGGPDVHRILQLEGMQVLALGFLMLCFGQVKWEQTNDTTIVALGGIIAGYCWGVYKTGKQAEMTTTTSSTTITPPPPNGSSIEKTDTKTEPQPK